MTMQRDDPSGFRLEDGYLVSCAPFGALSLPRGGRHVISIVGGGGKTTLLHYLASRYAALGMKTAAMTTTRMGCPDGHCETIGDCRARWSRDEYAVVGQRLSNGKFRAPEDDVLAAVIGEADILLVEADGAHRRPLKFPAAYEPVLLPETDIVIAVAGLDALGAPAGAVCHRMPEAEALLHCDAQHAITEEDMTTVLLSPRGGRKGAEGRTYIVALNKCDDDARHGSGERILRLLARRGQTRAAMLYFPPENRTGL